MDERYEFCARMLGDPDLAARVTRDLGPAGQDRLAHLTAAVSACRSAEPERVRLGEPAGARAGTGDDRATRPEAGLAAAVAAELAGATARLPQRQREALALRELLRLTHGELAAAIGIEAVAAAPLLARSRLRLRSELRGDLPPAGECPEHDRALRTIALRQDSEPVPEADEAWLIEHLGHCTSCGQAHAAMLEASVCYRAWRVPAGAPAAG